MPPKVDASPAQSANGVRELDAGAVSSTGYTLLRRVHAVSWMTALFLIPSSTEEGARKALLDAAAREGGDAVMNMQCLRSAGPGSGAWWRGYYCYGNIVKLK